MKQRKKKTLEDKLREVSHLAMAEEFNCKPRELDEIISSEHQLLEKLRSSGLSNEELLEMVGINSAQNSNVNNDDIKFYDEPDNDDD